jgi:hypothetical protein
MKFHLCKVPSPESLTVLKVLIGSDVEDNTSNRIAKTP